MNKATRDSSCSEQRKNNTRSKVGIISDEPLTFLDIINPYIPGGITDTENGAVVRSEDVYRKPWGHLLHTVKTGETAFEHVYNMGLFDYLAQNPETAELFDGAMTNYSITIID